jgi:hypothetical protein
VATDPNYPKLLVAIVDDSVAVKAPKLQRARQISISYLPVRVA